MSHPNSDSTTQREDPRTAGAQPPYEAQAQELPGSEAAMTPKADHGDSFRSTTNRPSARPLALISTPSSTAGWPGSSL